MPSYFGSRRDRLLLKRPVNMPSDIGARRRPVTFKWPWRKTPKPQHQFLGLPREIRDIIYHLILPSSKVQWDGTPICIPIDSHTYKFRRQKSSERCATRVTAILCTCRQVYLEASNILYKKQVFRYGPPYIEPTLLKPYDIPSNHWRAELSSTRPTVEYLPYVRDPLSTVARLELMVLFAIIPDPETQPKYDSTIVIELLARYATSLRCLSIQFDYLARYFPETFHNLMTRLPQLLNTFAALKTIEFRVNDPGRAGRSVMPVIRRCAEATAELGTWTFRDLSSVETNIRGDFPKPAIRNHQGRLLLRK